MIPGLSAEVNEQMARYDAARAQGTSKSVVALEALGGLSRIVKKSRPEEVKVLEAYRGDFWRYFGKPRDSVEVERCFEKAGSIETPKYPELDLLVGEYGFFHLHNNADPESALETFEETIKVFETIGNLRHGLNKEMHGKRSRFEHAANMAALSIHFTSCNFEDIVVARKHADASLEDALQSENASHIWNAQKSIAMTYAELLTGDLSALSHEYAAKASEANKALWENGMKSDVTSERNMIGITALYTTYVDAVLSTYYREVGNKNSEQEHARMALYGLNLLHQACAAASASGTAREMLMPNEFKIPYVVAYGDRISWHRLFAGHPDEKIRARAIEVKRFIDTGSIILKEENKPSRKKKNKTAKKQRK